MQIEYAPHLYEDFQSQFGVLEKKARASTIRVNEMLRRARNSKMKSRFFPSEKDLLITNYNREKPRIELKKIVYNINQRLQYLSCN